MCNRESNAPVVRAGGPVVSLTSYSKRIDTVYLAIESIARGTLLPSRLILWLDDKLIYNNPPPSLTKLKYRGLEMRLTKNYGPHKKYYPYVAEGSDFGLPLATADDDSLYPVFWLERLMAAYTERPDLINCYRARVIKLQSEGLAPYLKWSMCNSTEPSLLHFATGVSGVIYPPRFLGVLKHRGTDFTKCCPMADDIWLHVQALRTGYKVRQLVKNSLHFLMIPGTQHSALQLSNWGDQDSGNDRQAALTYTREDLELLARAIGRQCEETTR